MFYFQDALRYNEFMPGSETSINYRRQFNMIKIEFLLPGMRFIKKLVPQNIKNIYHLFQAILANFMYGFPAKSIKIIGVTGTNGKTTTVQMIAKILEEAGHKVAIASTINFKIGEKEWVNKTKFTTLSPFAVQQFILDTVKARCEYLVLETSSHSLDQCRIWGIEYFAAVITNVTREHLDYHKKMEKYRKAKLKLFKHAKVAIVNSDMEKPEEFLQFNNKKQITYSLKNYQADVFAKNIELKAHSSQFAINNSQFILNLPGEFNIENALAAVSVGISEDINLETCAQALGKIQGVPGRMEYVPNNKSLNIIVDYAVTPDSLEKLYTLIQRINANKNRIIAVFGSCGERDRGKRPIMGEIVSKYTDFIILTNEDPYYENPQRIIDEIEAGIKNKELGKSYWKILDRRVAIKKALQLAEPGDFVVVTGKGAEETMAIGKKRIPWNDKKVILEELAKFKIQN